MIAPIMNVLANASTPLSDSVKGVSVADDGQGRRRGRGRRARRRLQSDGSSSSSLSSSSPDGSTVDVTLRMLLPPALGIDEYSGAISLLSAWASRGLDAGLGSLGLAVSSTLTQVDVTSAVQRRRASNSLPLPLYGLSVVDPAVPGPILISLGGYDQDSQASPAALLLQTPLVSAGRTFQLSQVFSVHGYPPILGHDVTGLSLVASAAKALNETKLSMRTDADASASGALQPEQDGKTAPRIQVDPLHAALVTGSQRRVAFTHPQGQAPPSGAYGRIAYSLLEPSGGASEPGIVWIVPPHRRLLASHFDVGPGGWRVSGNG